MANKNKNNQYAQYAQRTSRQSEEDSQDYSAFVVVLFYCSLIVFFPVITFFALKLFVLDSFFTLTEIKTNIFSAVGAVLSLHGALGLYIYRAYFGGGHKTQPKQD